MLGRYAAAVSISVPLVLGFASGVAADEKSERPAYRPPVTGVTCQTYIAGNKLLAMVVETVEINGRLYTRTVFENIVKENPTPEDIKTYRLGCGEKK